MRKVFVLVIGLLLFGANTYAAPGDLVVNGNLTVGGTISAPTLSVGAGGVKFPDGSTQTTAKRLVWDYTVTGSAVTSVTTNGVVTLDGLAHGGYEFEVIIYNPLGNGVDVRMYCNGNTTNGNYYYSDTTNAWSNDAVFVNASSLPAGKETRFSGDIHISPRGYINASWFYVGGDYINRGYWNYKYTQAENNLTRIDWVTSTANGIGINSRFRLWKRIY